MTSLVLFYVVVVLSLPAGSIEGNLPLSLLDSEVDNYKNFIQAIRQYLTENSTSQLYGIPVLKKSVPDSERFISINIINGDDETITLAVDVLNLGVVGYRSKDTSYMFLDAPQVAFEIVFPSSTCRVLLGFNSDYESIESAAGTTRLETLLGFDPMDLAISNLFHYRQEFVPESFLVIFQMVLEGVKFKFIEQSIIKSINNGYSFKPGLAIVSLEDNWANLSSQIQASPSLQGLFGEVIELYDSNDKIIQVDSMYYPIIITNIAMQLYHCNDVGTTNVIRMSGVDDELQNDSCYVQTRTTRISGRAGLCVDAANKLSRDGNPIILLPCGQKTLNQEWTFQRDGTIQFSGKCLTFNVSNSVVIYNCRRVAPSLMRWKVSMDGTISNPSTGLVLTANSPARNTKLTVEANTNTFGQCWRVGNYVKPIIASIIGLEEMCLEATNKSTNIWLEDCVKNKAEQYWALYSDGTIRVNSSRNLCVSASTSLDCSSGLITIRGCNGSSNQRWNFMADGTILNPKCGMGMDVEGSDVTRKRIILYPKTGQASQQWALFY